LTSPEGPSRRGIIALAVILVAAMAAWVLWPRDRPDLVVVGDSVTFLSIPAIEDELGDDFDLSIRAYPGQASNDLTLVVLQELVERDAVDEQVDAIALLVGYNDVLRFRDRPDEVEELVALAADASCGVVLAVPAPPEWSDQEDFAAVRAAFAEYGDRLEAEVERHDHLHHVTSWQEAVEASGPGELVDTDGVHPVEAGQRALARAYSESVRRYC